MPTVYFGTKDEPGFELKQSDDLIAVRTRSGRSIAKSTGPVPDPLSAEVEDGALVVAYPEAGVEVLPRACCPRRTIPRCPQEPP